MLSNRRTYPLAGPMCCPPSRNGNMPAVRVRRRPIRGEIRLQQATRITRAADWARPAMSANMLLILGAFLICMVTCGSGPRTGIRRPIPTATRWWIQQDRRRVRPGLGAVALGSATPRTNDLRSVPTTPPATDPTALASVLVSKIVSNEEGRKVLA
ncbi:MAG: hypothetical protein VX130_01370 [Verrucomicrobiota bacterium]|nr:hypothetical protein [Verrucomicrobiota bacterium]